MPILLPLSLRTRLLLGIGLGWLALVAALLAYSHLSGGKLTRHDNLVHLEYEARLVADQMTRELAERQGLLARLAQEIDLDDPKLVERLRRQHPLLAMFDRLMVFDAEGKPVADWPPFAEGGPTIAERPYFKRVRAFRRPLVTEPYSGGETAIEQVMVVQPLLGEQGEFLGILGGNTALRDGEAYLNLRGRYLGEAGHVLLMTAEGQVISHPDPERLMLPLENLEDRPLLDQALLGWQGGGATFTLDGEPALASFRQVWAADWVVGVYLPLDQVKAPLRRYAAELRWVGIGTVLLMLPLLWWLLGLGLRPLRRLERQIARIGRGESQRLELATGMQELRQLEEAFNRLEGQRRAVHASLEAREAFLRAVLASSPVGMFIADTRGHVSYLNPALEHLTGVSLSSYRPLAWLRRIHPEDRAGFLAGWREALARGSALQQHYRLRGPTGDWRRLDVQASRVVQGGCPLGFVGLIRDVTDHHERERRHRWEAEHDALTGSLNRRGFLRRLADACRLGIAHETPRALVMLDLDHFKTVNDRAGHAVGDALLQQVARVLGEVVREEDHVARLGGDEFAVLLAPAPHDASLHVAERIREALARMVFEHAGERYVVSASVGVAMLTAEDESPEALMERADQASYRAKRLGRNRVVMAEEMSLG
ncbi:MAG: sensor domain-containing diguanylate cyclase [Pseudomonadota bacterium]